MTSDENKLKQLYFIKRILFVVILLYVLMFFFIKASSFSADNADRFIYDLRYAISGDKSYDTIAFWDEDIVGADIFKGGLVTLTDNTLAVYSRGLYRYSAHSVVLHTPVLKVNDTYILAFDRGGTVAYIADSFDLLHTLATYGQIIDAGMSEDGYTYTVTESYGYKARLTVYDEDMREIFFWDSSDCYLMSAAFADDMIYAVSIVPNGAYIDTYIHCIDYTSGKVVGENIVSSAMPLSWAVKSGGEFELVSDDGIYIVDVDSMQRVYSFAYAPERLIQNEDFVIYSYSEYSYSPASTVVLVDSSGQELFALQIEELSYIHSAGRYVQLISDGRLMILDTLGNTVLEKELDIESSRLITDGEVFVLLDADKAYRLDLEIS